MEAAVKSLDGAMVQMLGAGSDNTRMKAAEAFISTALKDKRAPAVLLRIMQSSDAPESRQLAGVLLRFRMLPLYNRESAEGRLALKGMLLSRLATEPARPVRKAIIGCAVSLAKALVPTNNWPEVIPFLQAALSQRTDEPRELAMMFLLELVDAIGLHVEDLLPQLKPLVVAGLRDGSRKVRFVALRVLAVMFDMARTEEGQELLADCVAPMMMITQQCLGLDKGAGGSPGGAGSMSSMSGGASGAGGGVVDEDTAVIAFETLAELVEGNSPAVQPHMEGICKAMLAVLINDRLEYGTRDAASSVLHTVVSVRPKWFVKQGLLPVFVPPLMRMLLTYNPEEEEADLEEARKAGIADVDVIIENAWTCASRLLDRMCIMIPNKTMFTPLMDAVMAWQGSASWQQRHAAMMMFGIMAEGCAQPLRESLPKVLPVLLKHVDDPNATVRGAALHSLSMWAAELQPLILRHHSTIMPAAIKAMGDSDQGVVFKACLVLESYCQDVGPTAMVLYVRPLMDRLGVVLNKPQQLLYIQEVAVDVLASVAAGVENQFMPYVGAVTAALQRMLAMTDATLLRLRAKATECMGHIALAIGQEAFAPLLRPTLASVHAAASLDDPELHTACFNFFSATAEVMGQTPDFAALVPSLVPFTINAIQQADGTDVVKRSAAGAGDQTDALGASLARNFSPDEEDPDADDDDEAINGGSRIGLYVNNSIVEVRESAVRALGALCGFCGPAVMGPHLKPVTDMLVRCCAFIEDSVRDTALTALRSLLQLWIQCYPLEVPPGKKAPPKAHPGWQAYCNIVEATIHHIVRDSDKDCVASCCSSIQHFCRLIGPLATVQHGKSIVNALLKVLRGEADCQLDEDADGSDDDEQGYEQAAAAAVAAHGSHGAAQHAGADDNDDEEEEDEEDEEEADEEGERDAPEDGDDVDSDMVLLDLCTDAMVAAAESMGSEFTKYAKRVMSALRRLTKADRDVDSQLAGIGCMGELVRTVGPLITEQIPTIIDQALVSIKCGHPDIQRNAVFCLGMCIQRVPEVTRPRLGHILQACQPLFAVARDENTDFLVDNVASTVARAMATFPDAVPMALALRAVLSVLPLRADRAEDEPLYGSLLTLLVRRHPDAVAAAPALLSAVAIALLPGSPVAPKVQAELVASGLRAAAAAAQRAGPAELTAFQAAVDGLPGPHAEAVRAALRSGPPASSPPRAS